MRERALPEIEGLNISNRRVVITGIGVVAAQPLMDVLAGRTPEKSCAPEITAFEIPEGAPTWGYEVLDLNVEFELPNVKSFIDRTSALALVAGKRALADAGLLEREKRPAGLEIGCAYGTMMGCLDAMALYWTKVKTSNPKFAQPLVFTHGYANSPSSLLCIENALHGPAATFSGERNAGMEALMFAFDQIRTGAGEAILVCASESLSQPVWNHFFASGELTFGTPQLILGEGSVAIQLESEECALNRSAPIKALLSDIQIATNDADPRNACCFRFNGEQRSESTEGDLSFLAGDALSVEPFMLAALAMKEFRGGTGGIIRDMCLIESRPVGHNRFQAQIKKS